MFSPFRDAQGNPKQLADVTYADLDQLRDLDEGYALEFKRNFSGNVQKKIPKIIASFANSAGGWLVVGIADDDKSVCPVPKLSADYGQIIGEIARRHITPTPRFDVRFVPDPEAPRQGVVLIEVAEGDFPPYVADGIVEVREGSTSGPAVGSALVELYDKATKRRLEVRKFCERTVYYALPELPLFNLYLFHMGRRGAEATSREASAERRRALEASFRHQGMSCRVQHAHDSLIFRVAAHDDFRTPHSAIELFGDESMKLSVPVVLLTGEARERALATLMELAGESASGRKTSSVAVDADMLFPEPVRIMSAVDTLARVTRMAALLDRYVREREAAWQQYAVAYELENMAGVVLWSDDPTYQTYVAEHGALYCATTDCVSRVRYLNDGAHNAFRARQFAGSHFFEACGLPLGSPSPEDNALVDALLRTAHGAAR